jgi:hypothetical protein
MTALKTPKEAAAYLGLTCQYIYQLKHAGKGPKYRKISIGSGGGPGPRERIFYSVSDLDLWNAARTEKKAKKPAVKKPRAKAKKTARVAEAA